jgi:hypothetical protein
MACQGKAVAAASGTTTRETATMTRGDYYRACNILAAAWDRCYVEGHKVARNRYRILATDRRTREQRYIDSVDEALGYVSATQRTGRVPL